MNFVHIAGHIGKDPETRYTADGQKVTVFSVATNIRRGGNDETIWWRVTLWGDKWDKMLPYLTKGKPVMIGGDLTRKPEIYTDKNGLQQVSSFDVTADYVKFSPFGKPDQAGSDQKQPGQPFQSSPNKNSFSDSGKKKNFGGGNQDSEPGFGGSHQSQEDEVEEESLPF